jgi:hypothetical protein
LVVPWVWTGLFSVVSGTSLLLSVSGDDSFNQGLAGAFLLSMVLVTALGAVIATKRPENPISWLFFITGAGMFLAAVIGPLIPLEAPTDPTVWTYMALVVQNALVVATIFYPLLLLFYVFPTGRFFTRRWAWAGWFGAVMVPTLLLVAIFSEVIGPAFEDDNWLIENPIGFIPWSVLDGVSTVWVAGLVAVAILGIPAVIVRYRKSPPLVRTQIKWLGFPGLIFAISFILIVTGVGGENEAFFTLIWVVPLVLIPLSMTVAIIRYRLFEIDRIISRTISYSIVVALLAVTYVGLVILGSSFLPSDNPLVVAGSTLTVAALFNPLRRRIQHSVDRRFNRSGYQAAILGEEFATKLREPLSSQEIMGLWTKTVEEAVQPQAAGIWLKET